MGTIATVVAGNQITVTGPVAPTFTTTASGQPCRVSWGTDNSSAYVAAQTDALLLGVKYLWHPRAANVGKTVYCAFKLGQRGNADNYFFTPYVSVDNALLGTAWLGDTSVTGVLTDISGRLMAKRIVPSRSPARLTPSRDIIGRLHLPRTGVGTTVHVVEVGDSLTKYDPTAQSDAWFPMNTFEGLLQIQNPKKTFSFQNIANIGVGWSEMVDPTSGLSWVIPGPISISCRRPAITTSGAATRSRSCSGINLALGSGNDGGGMAPDIILTTAALKADRASQAAAYSHEGHMFTEILLRTMARNQNRGLVDLNWQSEQVLHGASNFHRELQELPQVLGWAFSTTNPFMMNTDCYSWSAQVKLTAASAVWTAVGALHIRLSPMPGNSFIIDVDPVANMIRYEGRLWGRTVPTTVTTSGSTLTTVVGTASNGTLTWTGGQNAITLSSGGFTGKAGQCILLPGRSISQASISGRISTKC